MGLPFWELPDRLSVGGTLYPIDTDFRVGLRLRQLFWDAFGMERADWLFAGIGELLFRGGLPDGVEPMPLLCTVLWYLLDGRVPYERILRQTRPSQDGDRYAALVHAVHKGAESETVFSYLWDMPALYAAFLQVYRIDLSVSQMHLWQFDALFASLPEDCALCRTMALRASGTDDAGDDSERAALAARKLACRVPDTDVLHTLQICTALHGFPTDCSFASTENSRETDGGDGLE